MLLLLKNNATFKNTMQYRAAFNFLPSIDSAKIQKFASPLQVYADNLKTQQNFNNSTHKVQIVDVSRVKIGKNLLMSRQSLINNQIGYEKTLKLRCKDLF